MSQQFTVQPGMITYFMDAAVSAALRDERCKWKLGVGAGVGVAVPIIIGAITAWFLKLKKAGQDQRKGHRLVEHTRVDVINARPTPCLMTPNYGEFRYFHNFEPNYASADARSVLICVALYGINWGSVISILGFSLMIH